jgi:hypothetical protein
MDANSKIASVLSLHSGESRSAKSSASDFAGSSLLGLSGFGIGFGGPQKKNMNKIIIPHKDFKLICL